MLHVIFNFIRLVPLILTNNHLSFWETAIKENLLTNAFKASDLLHHRLLKANKMIKKQFCNVPIKWTHLRPALIGGWEN